MTIEWINQSIIFIMLHILGTALGAGAAFTGDIIFLSSVRKKMLAISEVQILETIGKIVWIGLLILLLSGIGLTLQRPEIFLHSGKFWAKMTIVAILSLNGLVFLRFHLPTIRKSVGEKFSPSSEIIKMRTGIVISGAISVISWSYVIILGVLGRTPFTYAQFFITYLGVLVIGCTGALLLKKRLLS